MYLMIKNDKPYTLVNNPERIISIVKEIGGWNIWHVWDMSTIPAKEIVDFMKIGTSYS